MNFIIVVGFTVLFALGVTALMLFWQWQDKKNNVKLTG
jgi:hypothetical protein